MRKTLLFFSLMAFAILQPEFTKAQDQTENINQRAQLVMDAFKDYTAEGLNARHGSQAAAARLKANNGNDQAMIDYIASYYDQIGINPGSAHWVNLPSTAWVLCTYWDKFTPAQRENIRNNVKNITNLVAAGTENHTITQQVGGYLLAQRFPNETGWHDGRTSEQLMSQTRTNLLNIMRSLYSKGYNEDLSTTYLGVHLNAYFVLYDCATDPEVKNAADAAITFHIAYLAANHFQGMVIPPFARENAPQANTGDGSGWRPGLHWFCWLYWGESGNKNLVPSNIRTITENRWVVHAALSNWRPSAAINSLALGQTAAPYELRSTRANFDHYGTGEPGEHERYVYRDKLYAMGSGNMRFRPTGYYVDQSMNGLIYQSKDTWNYIDWQHFYWRSNNRLWRGFSPFIQTAQHKSTAIVLFNIPTTDPWAYLGRADWQALRDKQYNSLIQEAVMRYPKAIDEKVESNGWIFLREGDVYIAIRPLKAYTIHGNYADLMTKYPSGSSYYLNHFIYPMSGFDVIRSEFGQTGFVIDVATKDDYASFAAFQNAVNANMVAVDWENFTVTYTNLRGNTLIATWTNPSPDYTDMPISENDDYIGNVNALVWIRPTFSVNGTTIGIDNDFTSGNAVIKSSSIELVNRKLQININDDVFHTVDWSEQNPVFSSSGITNVFNVNQ
jgi:hypothetical protein